MKRIQGAIVALVLLLSSASPLLARIIYDQSPCPGGGNWIVVTVIDDRTGQVISVRGTNCDGTTWTGHCTFIPITTNPNRPGMFYHSGEGGDWVRYNVSTDGMVTEMWGRDLKGEYYELVSMNIM